MTRQSKTFSWNNPPLECWTVGSGAVFSGLWAVSRRADASLLWPAAREEKNQHLPCGCGGAGAGSCCCPHPSLPARLMAAPALSHRLQLLLPSLSVCFSSRERSQHREGRGMEQSRWEAENKPCKAELIPVSSLLCAAFNHIIEV